MSRYYWGMRLPIRTCFAATTRTEVLGFRIWRTCASASSELIKAEGRTCGCNIIQHIPLERKQMNVKQQRRMQKTGAKQKEHQKPRQRERERERERERQSVSSLPHFCDIFPLIPLILISRLSPALPSVVSRRALVTFVRAFPYSGEPKLAIGAETGRGWSAMEDSVASHAPRSRQMDFARITPTSPAIVSCSNSSPHYLARYKAHRANLIMRYRAGRDLRRSQVSATFPIRPQRDYSVLVRRPIPAFPFTGIPPAFISPFAKSFRLLCTMRHRRFRADG